MVATKCRVLVTQLILVCAFVSTVKADIKLTLDLKPTFLEQKVNRTMDFEVTCGVFERWNRYRRQNTGPSRILTRLRILSQVKSSWQPIAQISNMEPDHVYVDPAVSQTSVDGSIPSNLLKEMSILRVKWNGPTTDAVNYFRCDATTFDSDYKYSGEYHWLDKRIETKKLNSFGLAFLSSLEKDSALRAFDKKEMKRSQNEISTEPTLDRDDVDEALKRVKLRLAQAIKHQTAKIDKTTEYLLDLLFQVHKNQTKMMENVESTLNSALEGSFLMLWPKGTFALPRPASGCPITAGESWLTGVRRHHTESLQRNKDEVVSGNHLQQPVLNRLGDNNFMYQRFCVKTDGESFGPSWPVGSYCINEQDFKCPKGFYKGQIKWTEETFRSDATSWGMMPSGDFEESYSRFYYCCRSDGSPDEPVDLPRFQPFYLYRYGGQCQQVAGMNVTEEFIRFDTENYYNGDSTSGYHPDAELKDIVLYLCYYEKASAY